MLAFAASIATGLAAASEPLFEFKNGIGAQPFRAANGVPVTNTVAGVNPGGAPWVIGSLKVTIDANGGIHANGKGLLLGGTDNLGTRAGPRQVVASLFCRNAPVFPAVAGTLQTVSYDSGFVVLAANGNFKIEGSLGNASGAIPTTDCGNKIDNRPVLLIRTVNPANPTTGTPATPGAWFAAGIIKD